MRILVYSDLHTEFEAFIPPATDAELVILAGDIGTKARGVKWANETFSCPVIYICGNHEFYGAHLDKTLEKMKAVAAPHVHVLENECWIWKQTRFLGATSWTDFSSTGSRDLGMQAAHERMNDFMAIRVDTMYRRLRPADLVVRNAASRAWLAQQLSTPFSGRTVVVTHHAPLIGLVDGPREHLMAAYANHWPDLVAQADLWVFGHTHHPVDVVKYGCRVVSNPRGYPGEGLKFRPEFEVEI